MAEAVTLAALHSAVVVDRALGRAAVTGRFGDGDLASIIAHQASAPAEHPPRRRVSQPGSRHRGVGGLRTMSDDQCADGSARTDDNAPMAPPEPMTNAPMAPPEPMTNAPMAPPEPMTNAPMAPPEPMTNAPMAPPSR